jgi:hypothetical protein
MGLDVGASLSIHYGSVLSNNSALSGGALCCDWCASFWTEETYMYDNTARAGSGGALWLRSSPAGARNVSMWGNVAPSGGAIAAISSPLNLTDCTLTNNNAHATHGGAVLHTAYDDGLQELLMTRCTVSNNTCLGGGGGVAAFSSAAVTLAACTLDYNTIDSASPAGGALLALDVPMLLMSACNLSWNQVTVIPALADDAPLGFVDSVNALGVGLGGALWVGSNDVTDAVINGSAFIHNKGPSAGAIYATGHVRLAVHDSDFHHDHASDFGGRGGGLVTDQHAALDVYDTWFFSCEANKGGATWHGGQSTARFTRCLFDENEGIEGEDMKGMAVRVDGESQVFVTGCMLQNQFGPPLAEGTIAMSGLPASHLTILDSIFENNVAHLGACLFIVRRFCDSAPRG